MTRQEVLQNVEAWLQSASDPTKNDISFTIRRIGIEADPTGRPQAVHFAIEAMALVAVWGEPLSNRIQPATGLTLVPGKNH